MLELRSLPRLAIAASALIAGSSLAGQQVSRAPELVALKGIDRGLWELRERGATAPSQKICVADPIALMQVRHGGTACSRFVIDNKPSQATVHYTCPGAGHGRTTIKVETRQLVRIESQGIAGNAPFNVVYEGRRTAACN